MAVHCSVLMLYFLLVIFYTGTHLVTPVPLSCFPEGQFDLLSAWHALFWRESVAFWKSHCEWSKCVCVFCLSLSIIVFFSPQNHQVIIWEKNIHCLVDLSTLRCPQGSEVIDFNKLYVSRRGAAFASLRVTVAPMIFRGRWWMFS